MRAIEFRNAAAEYRAQRVHDGVSKAELRNERLALNVFDSATGNLYVHIIAELQVARGLAACTAARRESCIQVLDDFFDWCRSMRYLKRRADPLRDVRNSMSGHYRWMRPGVCTRCEFVGLTSARELYAFNHGESTGVTNVRLCTRCLDLPIGTLEQGAGQNSGRGAMKMANVNSATCKRCGTDRHDVTLVRIVLPHAGPNGRQLTVNMCKDCRETVPLSEWEKLLPDKPRGARGQLVLTEEEIQQIIERDQMG